MIATFYQALAEQGQAKRALGDLLAGLLEYTRYHFSTEEDLMEYIAYPGLYAHRAEHAAFIAKVTDLSERYRFGRLVLSIEATSFLRDWLSNHILITDKRLGRHLTSSGLG